MYSGVVAAAAYRHLEHQKPSCVAILGFSHRGGPEGVAVPDVGAYDTPLGRIAVERSLARSLAKASVFHVSPEAALCDHSVEIQLPLVQKAAPGAAVLPLYVGRLTEKERETAADCLASVLPPDAVILASSDLTHYGRSFGFEPFPVDYSIEERLRHLDFAVIEACGSLREKLLFETLSETSATVCGYNPIALLLAVLRRLESASEIFQERLDYQTSGEITGDFHHSVSYGSLGYFPHSSFELDSSGQEAVIQLARQTLAEYMATGRREARSPEKPASEALSRRAPLFVTLHQDGRLRGCLGRTSADDPLATAVPELTLAAALDDSRFDPVSTDETGIEVEVSILSPLKRITGLDDFRVGEHGALLYARGRQGLLLPQVATERNWGAEEFLSALGVKAGAGQGAHLDPGARLSVFRAQIVR
jgi:AmmeMemoRadiSam system protein B/AmmeMemoRadiSam system protein A